MEENKKISTPKIAFLIGVVTIGIYVVNYYLRNMLSVTTPELLLSGMYTVSGAATMSGFDDISYCSREFKKKYGVSPREYIKTPRA